MNTTLPPTAGLSTTPSPSLIGTPIAPITASSETVPVVFKPEVAKHKFKPEDVVLAYHGNLLYEAIVIGVNEDQTNGTVYDLQYQGWMKCWNARVLSQYVFEHNETNLVVAHQLLRSAKARQQAIAPATTVNVPQPVEYEQQQRMVGVSKLSSTAEQDAFKPVHYPRDGSGLPPESPMNDDNDNNNVNENLRTSPKYPGERERKRPHGNAFLQDRPTLETTPGNSDDATNTPTSEKHNGLESEIDEDDNTSSSLFYLPSSLKQQLVDDWEFITKENKLVPLPRNESVAMIIDKWVRHREQSEDLACQEVADGLKAYFDAALPNILLYKFERLQYNLWFHGENAKAREQNEVEPKPSKFYGAEHLVRLLLKMPYMLESTGVVDYDMLKRIAEKTNELAKFMTDNGRLLFLPAYTDASKEYLDRIAKGNFGDVDEDAQDSNGQSESTPQERQEQEEEMDDVDGDTTMKEKR